MSSNPGNPEQRDLLEKLETVRLLFQQLLGHARGLPETEENTELLRTAVLIEEVDFDQMLADVSALLDNTSAESAIEKFKNEIAQRDQKVYEFKLSLADSVVELKNTQKSLQNANEKIAALSTQISQMQLHSKELSLKLSTATSNLTTREKPDCRIRRSSKKSSGRTQQNHRRSQKLPGRHG